MKHIYVPALASLSLLVAAACSNAASAPTPVQLIENDDSLPKGVKNVVRAIYQSDTATFANNIMYPLDRPYPLHDISDKQAMEQYYNVLVDDSLKKVITHSTPSQWNQFGWRGWTLLDGQYIWIDSDSIYNINYVSARETAIIDSLNNLDIHSLPPQLRHGSWKPVCCMKAIDNAHIYRIDLDRNHNTKSPAYRLSRFDSPRMMRISPSLVCSGYLEMQGSASLGTYHFSAPSGESYEFSPESPDGSPLTIDVYKNDRQIQSIPVTPAFWLDLLPKK